MRYELEMALALMRSRPERLRPNVNVTLSTLGIAVGVTMLFFTLAIYDGYVAKMETMVFGLFPQVTVRSTGDFLKRDEDTEGEVDYDALMFGDDKGTECARICAGERILSGPPPKEDSTLESATVLTSEDATNIVRLLAGVPGVRRMAPVILEEAQFRVPDKEAPGGSPLELPLRVLGIAEGPSSGGQVPELQRLLSAPGIQEVLHREKGAVLLSAPLYERLFGPKEGSRSDTFKELHLARLTQGTERVPGPTRTLRVVGTFRLGVHQVADNLVITDITHAQELLDMGGHVSMVGAVLSDPYAADDVAEAMRERLEGQDLAVLPWLAVLGDLFGSLTLYRELMLVVLLMAVGITAFNIYNNLTITVLERRQQIGVVRAVGARSTGLYRIFLLIGQFEALAGTLFGIILGAAAGYGFNEFLNSHLASYLPVQDATIQVRWDLAVVVLVFVSLVCAVTAWLPARQAVAMDVVEALRSE
jgi:ABC-type lipoprotein release transport system permease subunit